MTQTKYQLKDGDNWETCKKATTSGMKEGWLHYELEDGTIGLARPGTWREKPKRETK
jgi:hypothetical protein